MKNLISAVVIIIFLSLRIFSQPTVNDRFFETTNNGTNYIVKVQISTNTGTNILGDATIPFTFNTTNLVYVSTTFNNFSGGDYATASATNSPLNRIALGIVLNNTSGGTVVSSTFMDVATITFNIINSAGSSNLTFAVPLEFFSPSDPSPTQWINGTITNLNTNPLPVELVSFTASNNQNGVNLNWQTAIEVNNYGFEIERKTYDDQWEKVGFVAGYGNSNSPKTYSFNDKNLSDGSKFIYRLKQINDDGSYTYSNEIEVKVIPTEYELSQNYPNPFNPNTNIKYSLPTESKVMLEVFNIIGEKVADLVNEFKPAGIYTVTFDGSKLSSGTFFYRMRAGNFTQIKKLLLLK